MSEPARASEAAESEQGKRIAELERRIRSIESELDSHYGEFTRWDWWICTVGALLIPVLLLIWFRP